MLRVRFNSIDKHPIYLRAVLLRQSVGRVNVLLVDDSGEAAELDENGFAGGSKVAQAVQCTGAITQRKVRSRGTSLHSQIFITFLVIRITNHINEILGAELLIRKAKAIRTLRQGSCREQGKHQGLR